jgi:hypothetical protein
MAGYYNLILGHAVLAVITFLFIVPAAIFLARFHTGSGALRWHIYLQIMTVGLSTVVFVLGWFAVGPSRSLTNPHHGIGLAIYVLIMVQWLLGSWIYTRKHQRTRRRHSLKRYLHQWIGRATALLAIAQVPLGLTLYGSPRWTFVVYALWMAFLVLLYFIQCYRALDSEGGVIRGRGSSHGGTVISDKRPSRFGFLAPLVAGAGAAALLGRRRRSRSRSRSHSRSRRDEVIPSRRGSGTYVDEKFETRKRKDSGGITNTLLKGAALVGAAGLAKSFFDSRKRRRDDDMSDYTSVAPDTPSRRPSRRHHQESVISDESLMEQGRRPRTPLLPGPGDPSLAAAAISAAQARPTTPRPIRPHSPGRRSSYDTYTESYTTSDSPSRRPQKSGGVGKGLLAGLGLGWFAKKMADRRENKELARLDRLETERLAEERRRRQSGSRFTGDGFSTPIRKQRRPAPTDMSSDLSSIIPPDPHQVRPGVSNIPPIPTSTMGQSRSRHDITEAVVMPPAPPDPQGILHQESGSETYMSPGGHPHRRPSERRRRAGDRAAAEAVAAAAGLAAEEEARRKRSRSRGAAGAVESPPISVKVKVHGDKDRNVTLRRLTEAEAAAEKNRQNDRSRRTRADSMSSLSGSDVRANRQQRYRRSERAAERRAESIAPPPPLSPPNPSFAGGKRPVKDSAYFSGGRPGEPSALGGGGTSVGSPDSHGTWSEMSPSGAGVQQGSAAGASHEEKRRRRRLERNRQSGAPVNTVDFT